MKYYGGKNSRKRGLGAATVFTTTVNVSVETLSERVPNQCPNHLRIKTKTPTAAPHVVIFQALRNLRPQLRRLGTNPATTN